MLPEIELAMVASNNGELINKAYDERGALETLKMYGVIVLAGIFGVFQFGIYKGPSGYNPLITFWQIYME